jgi:hypothetical protein
MEGAEMEKMDEKIPDNLLITWEGNRMLMLFPLGTMENQERLPGPFLEWGRIKIYLYPTTRLTNLFSLAPVSFS